MNNNDIIQQKSFYIKARLLPTLIGLVPIIWTVFIVVNNYKQQLSEIYDILPWLTGLGIATAMMFLLAHVNRFISKELFQNIFFKEELYMPTTNHLLVSDITFNRSMKINIRKKIKEKYGISLLNDKEEVENEEEARRKIADTVPLIRNSLRGNRLLLQCLIEYNFMRNFIGACVISILFSIIALIISYCYSNMLYFYISLILLICYLIPIALSKVLIKRHGKNYSKTLYQQFLSL